ncbi:hypothetical protein L360_02426 [Enterobacter sp. MGH 14]|nr:hypothetical protein L360_02426 [Enterobacter sp. MGH 14]
MSILIVSWGQNSDFSFAFHIRSSRNFCRCADAILTGNRITKLKAITDENVFPSVKCEVSFPHSTIRITAAQYARVIVVSTKQMEIHKACRRRFFGTNFEASEVGGGAVSQTDVYSPASAVMASSAALIFWLYKESAGISTRTDTNWSPGMSIGSPSPTPSSSFLANAGASG